MHLKTSQGAFTIMEIIERTSALHYFTYIKHYVIIMYLGFQVVLEETFYCRSLNLNEVPPKLK